MENEMSGKTFRFVQLRHLPPGNTHTGSGLAFHLLMIGGHVKTLVLKLFSDIPVFP